MSIQIKLVPPDDIKLWSLHFFNLTVKDEETIFELINTVFSRRQFGFIQGNVKGWLMLTLTDPHLDQVRAIAQQFCEFFKRPLEEEQLEMPKGLGLKMSSG